MGEKWDRLLNVLRTGFWFVPTLMLLVACGLALTLLYLDERIDPGVKATLPWAYSGGPEGARSLLSTVAGSMITAASVTFSLTSVSLSIASQQYGSRVLRNFMRDGITQVMLGTFVSTFIYSVLVVRSIRGSDVAGGFVPAISVTVAITLSLASLILLIYFIHHVSASIQASQIVQVISDDAEGAIAALCPDDAQGPRQLTDYSEELRRRGRTALYSPVSGYLQRVDFDHLVAAASKHDLLVELTVKPGDHLVEGDKTAQLWGKQRLEENTLKKMAEGLLLGGQRTPDQDIRFQFQQLTDVVVRALSPGINDPFTALNGIDQLASMMASLAERSHGARTYADEKGVLRVSLCVPTVGEILEETVGHIGIYGASDRFVMAGLRKVLNVVETRIQSESDAATIGRLRRELDLREKAKAAA